MPLPGSHSRAVWRRRELPRLRAQTASQIGGPAGNAREHGPNGFRRRDAPGVSGRSGGPHRRCDRGTDLAPGPRPAAGRGARGRVRIRALRLPDNALTRRLRLWTHPPARSSRPTCPPSLRSGHERHCLRRARHRGTSRGRPRSAIADQAIREAAVDLFAERGFEGFSVEDGGSPARARHRYRRYPSKVDLVVEAGSCLATDEMGSRHGQPARRRPAARVRSSMRSRTRASGKVMPVMTFERRRYPRARRRLPPVPGRSQGEDAQPCRPAGRAAGDTDIGVMSSMLVGLIFHRLMITQEPLNDAFVDALVDAPLRGFGAMSWSSTRAASSGSTSYSTRPSNAAARSCCCSRSWIVWLPVAGWRSPPAPRDGAPPGRAAPGRGRAWAKFQAPMFAGSSCTHHTSRRSGRCRQW